MARKPLSTKRAPGRYMYANDWLRDARLQTCSRAARCLWFEMIMLMLDARIDGVLPGNLEDLARAFGVESCVRDAWATGTAPLVEELEGAGVFTRGAKVKEKLKGAVAELIPDDAICSRRLLREWVVRVQRSAAGKRGAAVRWRNKADGKQHSKPHSKQHGKTMANGVANTLSNDTGAESPANRGASEVCAIGPIADNIAKGYGKKMHISTSYSGIDPSIEGSLDDESIMLGNVLARVAHDESLSSGPMVERIKRILRRGHRDHIMTLMDRIEKNQDPAAAQGRGESYIAKPAAYAQRCLMQLDTEGPHG